MCLHALSPLVPTRLHMLCSDTPPTRVCWLMRQAATQQQKVRLYLKAQTVMAAVKEWAVVAVPLLLLLLLLLPLLHRTG